ncbi:hypothetical protein C0993_004517, partial [Termitomyces sp. T159_Od127]
LEVELMLAEVFQDNACDPTVLLKHFCVDENVIKVYAHYTFSNEVPEDVVHHGLEGGQAISESKKHKKRFKQSPVGPEGSLPLISLMNAHIVVTPLDIQFCEVLCPSEVIDELRNEGEEVAILHCLERAILLFNEEDGRSHQQLGGADVTRVQDLLKESIKLVLFFRQ